MESYPVAPLHVVQALGHRSLLIGEREMEEAYYKKFIFAQGDEDEDEDCDGDCGCGDDDDCDDDEDED